MAVFLLDLKSGDNVLDLCCAPGGKLVLSGLSLDAIDEENGGTVTGVDISKSRLLSAQSLVKKFKLSKARLFLQNSLDFHIGPLAPVKQSTSPLGCSRLVKLNKEKKSALNMKYLTFATSLLRKSPCLQYSEPKYSKVPSVEDAYCVNCYLDLIRC